MEKSLPCGPTRFPNLCACGHLNNEHGPQPFEHVSGAVYARKPKGRKYTWVIGGPCFNDARRMIRWELCDGSLLYFWSDGPLMFQLERPSFVGPLKAFKP